MNIKDYIKKIFNNFGIKIEYISAKNDEFIWLIEEMQKRDVTKLLDVGANSGQFGANIRKYGFEKEIISFEPLAAAFKDLQAQAQSSKNWVCYNFALGDKNESSKIEVAGNSFSSSLLPMMQSHIKSAPASKPVGYQEIVVKRLDAVFEETVFMTNNVLLKIDTQGFELNVLKGSGKLLEHIQGVQVELSFVPLYEKQPLFPEVFGFLYENGFKMLRLENEFSDPNTGELLQANGYFFRD
ncbi:MAG: FkbM family methyltransferase [Ignavibacteriales bacterium]|nr:FkbM family methyltransferase [Ignavibacteriales bacterium]